MTVVCIAGAHRSGTSMVSRALNLLGLYLGPESEVSARAEDNPEGFWENLQFVRLNDEILLRNGGAWDMPPVLRRGWELHPNLNLLYQKAQDVIKPFGERPLWGWKDPRNSLTLDFWKKVVPNFKTVICLRNPLEVVQSLSKRGYTSHVFGFNLWLAYNERFLTTVAAQDRIVTHFESFFVNPRAELERIAGFLGISYSEAQLTSALESITTSLRHNQTPLKAILNYDPPFELLRLYQELCLQAGPVYQTIMESDADKSIANLVRLFEHQMELSRQVDLIRLPEEKDELIEKLRKDVSTLDKMVRAKDHELVHLAEEKNEQIEKLRGDVSTLGQMVRDKDNELMHLSGEKDKSIEKLSRDVAMLDHMVRDKEEYLIYLTNYINKQEHKPLLQIPAPRTPTGNMAVCTIASKNYLAQVRIFAKSMSQSNPGVPVYVLIVDRAEGKFDPALEPYHVIFLEELMNIPNPEQMFFKYTPIELNTAVKPYFLEYLMQKFQLDGICYFDPDIYVFSKLNKIWELLDKWSMVLTPHILTPYPEDDLRPTEIEINLAGVFNLGFIGISNIPSAMQFLRWWQKRLYEFCYLKPSQGMHVDQNWVNFAPTMHDRVFILRDPAYNIAYWNLHERASDLIFENNQLTIGHRPVVFFHYSGITSKAPDLISVHQNRFSMKDYPNVRPIYQFYLDLLDTENHTRINQWTYAFGSFDNGVKIPDVARTLYARADRRKKIKFGNPFSSASANSFFSWINQPVDHLILPDMPVLTRLHMELYNARPDLKLAYPEPLGANRLQVIHWLEKHAVEDFNIDPYFVPGRYYTKLSEAKTRFGRMRFLMKKFMVSIHPRLKEGISRIFPPHSLWFQKLQIINKKYVEKNIGIVYPAIPQQDPEENPLPFGVNVAGYIQGEFGVAEVARSSLKSLAAADVPHVLNNIRAQAYRDNDPTFAEFSPDNPYRVNLIHVNADQTIVFANERGPAYFQGRYNVACWFWELSVFPEQWRPAFDYLQEIWVASSFCQESIASVAPIPVVKVNFPIVIDEDQVRPNRQQYGLPEGPFIFGFTFDFHSLAERKNPHGLIKAFEMAFEDRKDVLLVIKSINGEHAPKKMQQLRDFAQDCRVNLQFIDGYLPRHDAISLVATFDSYVSLHRSEGLGIGMTQAMYLKKPVIATGYSGNMEFMNHNNSFLVRYQLAELQENYGPYEKGNVWAEPDVEHAAMLMRQVYEDRRLAEEIAERASVDIRTRMVPEVTGRAMKARLQVIA